MTYLVRVSSGQFSSNCRGGFVRKEEGAVRIVKDPRDATQYPDKDAAEAGKIGHHRDMGGSGFKGQIVAMGTQRLPRYR